MTDATVGSYPKGRRKRAEIVHAAFEAFGTLGYRTASMSQIAAACGVTRAGLAHHFATKEELLTAVLEERDAVDQALFFGGFEGAAVDSSAGVFDRSAGGLEVMRRFIRVVEHNAESRGIVSLFAVLSAEAADPQHPAHDYFVARYRRLRASFRMAFESLEARGLLRPGVDITGAELDLIAFVDGLQIQWLLDPDTVDMAARLRRRLDEMISAPLG